MMSVFSWSFDRGMYAFCAVQPGQDRVIPETRPELFETRILEARNPGDRGHNLASKEGRLHRPFYAHTWVIHPFGASLLRLHLPIVWSQVCKRVHCTSTGHLRWIV